MGNDAKYIIYDYKAHVFHNHIQHAEYARLHKMQSDEIQSAGFVSFSSFGEPHCYGNSVSLRTESRGEEDIRFISSTLQIHIEPEIYIPGRELYNRECAEVKRLKALLEDNGILWKDVEVPEEKVQDKRISTKMIEGLCKVITKFLPKGSGFVVFALEPSDVEGDPMFRYSSNLSRKDGIGMTKKWLFQAGEEETWMKHLK